MYSRKQFANIVGAEKSELYYYEKRGLLLPDDISSNGYRYYAEDAVKVYKHIQDLQFIGYSLDEIQSHLSGSDGASDQEFYDRREKILMEQLIKLKQMRAERVVQKKTIKKRYVRPIAKKNRW